MTPSLKPPLLALAIIGLIITAGCINSNEFVPVTPSDVYPSAQMDRCFVRIEGTMYQTNNMDTCGKLVVNQTNWVKFCPESALFPICNVRKP